MSVVIVILAALEWRYVTTNCTYIFIQYVHPKAWDERRTGQLSMHIYSRCNILKIVET